VSSFGSPSTTRASDTSPRRRVISLPAPSFVWLRFYARRQYALSVCDRGVLRLARGVLGDMVRASMALIFL
jgi:hypothetical protein